MNPGLDGDRGLGRLRAMAQDCPLCPLAATRTRVVFGEGPAAARLMLLGEAPGADEDAIGRPFVGAAGQALNSLLASVGIDRGQIYVANVVMCRPPGRPPMPNREPTTTEVVACTPYLDLQLAVVRPTVMVTLGVTPTQRMLGPVESLESVRGQPHPTAPGLVIPTWHPSAWRYGPGRRAETEADLRLALSLL